MEGSTSISGPVCVGVIPTIAPYFLPPLLATFARRYPQARVTVVEEITPLLLDKMRSGAVDVAVVAVPLQTRGHEFQSFPLIEEKLYAALPKQHKLAKRRSVTLGELQDEPFLLLRDGHCFRETAVAACKRARVRPKIIFESGQFSSILSMVCAGLGVSIIPAMALEKRPGCQFVPLADGRATRAIGAVTLNGRSLSRVQQAFLTHLTATHIASTSAQSRGVKLWLQLNAYRAPWRAGVHAAAHAIVRALCAIGISNHPPSVPEFLQSRDACNLARHAKQIWCDSRSANALCNVPD